jgi:hypothetical protein
MGRRQKAVGPFFFSNLTRACAARGRKLWFKSGGIDERVWTFAAALRSQMARRNSHQKYEGARDADRKSMLLLGSMLVHESFKHRDLSVICIRLMRGYLQCVAEDQSQRRKAAEGPRL